MLAVAVASAMTACGDDDSAGDGEAAVEAAQSCLEDAGFEVRREDIPPGEFQELLGLVDFLVLPATDDAIGSGTISYFNSDEKAQASLDTESVFTEDGAEGKVGLATYFVRPPELATTIEGCL